MKQVCVRVNGVNFNRLIDKIVSNNIALDSVKIKNKSLYFNVNEVNLQKIKEICNSERKDVEIVSKNLNEKIKHCLCRGVGFALAFVIVFSYLFSYGLFVTKVNVFVNGDSDYNLEKIENFLTSHNISVGATKTNINFQNLERSILNNFDDIAGCSIKIYGSEIHIEINPTIKKDEVLHKELYSNFDAVVTDIELLAGNAVVKKGDVVKQGELLVKSDDVASAKIKGVVNFVGTEIYNENRQYEEKTGKSYSYKNYKIRNKYLVKQSNNCSFLNYKTKKCVFYFTNGFLFPLLCEEFICYETVLKEEIIPFKEVEEFVMKNAYNKAASKIKNLSDIKEVSYSVVSEGAYTRVDCYLQVEIDLC